MKDTEVRQLAETLVTLLARGVDPNDLPFRTKILYEDGKPALWELICLTAQKLGVTDQVVRIWLRLEEVNGLRRQPGKDHLTAAMEKLRFIKELIEQIGENHPQSKQRLLGLWCYHGAMVYHALGEFQAAADCHKLEVDLAASGRDRTLARFNQSVELASSIVVMVGRLDSDAVSQILHVGREALRHLGTSAEDKRWSANILCHSIFWGWLGRQLPARKVGDDEYTSFTVIVAHLSDLPAEIKPAFAHAMPVIQAIAKLVERDYAKAAELASNPATKAETEWHGYALLVRLVALGKMWRQDQAMALVRAEIGQLEAAGSSFHLAKAIFEHNLLP